MQERIQSVNGQIERLESQAQFIFQRDDLLLRRIAEIDKVFKNSPRDFKTVLQFLKDNTTINKDIEDLKAQSSLIEIKAKEIVDSEIDKIVDAILKTGPSAVENTKRLARESLSIPLDTGLSSEAAQFALCFASQESKEGISAFLGKRSPNFKVADEDE